MELRVAAGEVFYDNLRLESVTVAYHPGGRFEVEVGHWSGPGETWLGEGLRVDGAVQQWSLGDRGLLAVAAVRAWGLEGTARLSAEAGVTQGGLELVDQPLAALADLPGRPESADWLKGGRFDARLAWNGAASEALTARFEFAGLGFDSPDGRFAGEKLQGEFEARAAAGLARIALSGRVAGGQLLLDDFYRDFDDGGLQITATAHAAGEGWVLAPLRLADDGPLAVDATLAWGVEGLSGEPSLQVNRLELAFPGAYRRYLEPVASVYALDGLEVTGRLAWFGEWADGRLQSGDLELDDLSLVDVARGRFALTGLAARLRPGDHAFDSSIAWQGLILGRVNLGPGRAEIDSEPGVLALRQPLALQVMGGSVDLERLRIDLPGAGSADEPDLLLRARLRDLDVERLTEAFGWPSFSGRLSGEIPDVTLDQGVLELDGEIRVDVFDGRIAMSGLRVERPFGVLPSLAADVAVEGLDLEQLTGTFEFGRISGRLDGYVRNLRMLDWRPVAFDAWLGTPADAGRANAISRQAVNRLTAIGGGGATAALTSPVMRMFSNFSYRRLGLGCQLSNNVCALRGLSDDGQSVVMLEGAGIPKITIRAFNRNLDWPRMVSNLVAVSEGESVVVGEPPSGP